ncbi:TIGR00366 family protein [Alicyclobacillus macrosporangiidus]|uniref:Short-chain fatty acids transporter n=1 Tax=Alicyclobacillus macrosporangiidus TaxID=392015 RepID=A0A1I7KJR5_9BACL|nr:TIGR00366 family protein [Alicyclobacillus macrosporangiidus]SFU97698.1 short-chain fatty acids transporter [Alicyclobacillus macrosporangiidus]
MFRRFTNLCVAYVQRFMPDPYLFAVILTLIVVVLDFLCVKGVTLGGVVRAWYDGVWGSKNIFTFALQMILILVSGYTLAQAPVIRRLLGRVAAIPKNQVQAAITCFFAAGVASLLNWGLGLVVGAIVAKEIAKKLREHIHFAYIVAAGYMGFIVWASGFSSSIALANTDPKSSLNIIYQLTKQTVPFHDTIFQPYNWLPVLAAFVLIPILLKRMAPTSSHVPPLEALEETAAGAEVPVGGPGVPRRRTFAEVLESAWILNLILAVAGLAYFVMSGWTININSMVMLFTILSLLLHWTPIRFIRAFTEAAKSSGSLLLQYPLYGGIMALMAYTPAKGVDPLQVVISNALVHGATAVTLPFLNFIGSLIITLFVPSGGGHWGVQGPVTIQTAVQMGITDPGYLGRLSMSVAFGEQVGNMIQPFWALPVLALAKLGVRDMMGFAVVAFLIGFVIFGIATFIPAL